MRLIEFQANRLFSLGSISVPLSNQGLVLITGYSEDDRKSNGSGKSNLVNKGLIWGLYGQTPHGLKSDKVINRYQTDGKTFARVVFEGVDGKRYTIYRQRNPATVNLYSGSTDISGRSERDTQEKINRLLGMDFNTFCHTSIYGQGIDAYFATLTPSQQREIIEHILPLPTLTEWGERAKTFRKEIESILAELSAKIEEKTNQLEKLNTTLTQTDIQKKAWEKSQREKIDRLLKEVKENAIVRDTYKTRIRKLEDEIESYSPVSITNIEKYEKRLDEFREKAEARVKELRKHERAINEKKLEIARLESLIIPLNKETKICPTCNQQIPDKTYDVLKEEQDNIQFQINNLKMDVINLERTMGDVENDSKLKEYNLEIKAIESLLAKAQKDRQHLLSLKEELARLKTEYASKEDTEILTFKIQALKDEKNPYEEKYNLIKTQIEETESEIKKAEKEVSHLEKEKGHLTFWETAYLKTLKQRILSQTCPYLNERVAKHLQGLNNNQFRVEFTLFKNMASGAVKEEFNVNVESLTGGDGINALSGGEQSIVNFAIGLALSDLATSQISHGSNVLILDEPFTELDHVNCENIVNYLTSTLNKEKESIFLISNDDALATLIPNRIHVVKQNGISTIAE